LFTSTSTNILITSGDLSDKSSFAGVEDFIYLGTSLTNQNLFSKKLRAD